MNSLIAEITARIKYWAWKLLSMAVIAPIYIAIVSDGLRYLIPPLGQKLSKLPFLQIFGDYESTHRIDLAHPMALVLLFAVWWLWDRLLMAWLGGDIDYLGFDPDAYNVVVNVLGISIVSADAMLFYLGATQSTWGGTAFSFSALLATIAYVAILVFVSFVSCVLRRQLFPIQPLVE